MKEFEAELKKAPDYDAAYINLPFDPVGEYGTRNKIKVKTTIDGEPYRGTIMDMGLVPSLIVIQSIRKKINKNPGDKVHITIEEDKDERIVEIPDDLAALFHNNTNAKEFFSTLSFTNQKEYVNWILSARREQTRKDHLLITIDKLLLKKKNPSDK
jgi:c-di-GMP-binding flagellar brake protein YcgR